MLSTCSSFTSANLAFVVVSSGYGELALLADESFVLLRRLNDVELYELREAVMALPSVEPSMCISLQPAMKSVETRRVVAYTSPNSISIDELIHSVDRSDVRLRLATAALSLVEAVDIDDELAACAVVELASPSTALLSAAVLASLDTAHERNITTGLRAAG